MTSAGVQEQMVEVPAVDQGNPLLGETPAHLSCALMQTPAGQRLVMTVRTPSTTLSVLLCKEDAAQWAEVIRAAAVGMSGLILAGPVASAGPAGAGG